MTDPPKTDRAVHEMLGVVKGMVRDGEVTESECTAFTRWLISNPGASAEGAGLAFANRILEIFQDGVITKAEREELYELMNTALGDANKAARTGLTTTFADEWLPIAGESHYRDEFEALLGPSNEHGEDEQRTADLICEPENPYDHNAVAVWISGRRVGFLSRDSALLYHQNFGDVSTQCVARITAGWDNGGPNRGDYCVRLALALRQS